MTQEKPMRMISRFCLLLLCMLWAHSFVIAEDRPTKPMRLWSDDGPGAIGKEDKDIPTLTPFWCESAKASGGLTGVVSYQSPHRRGGLEFRYQFLRVWQRPAETFLVGGLGTIPLAPLSGVSQDALPGAINRMAERLSREAAPADAAKLWAATYILMGLRYPAEFADQLLQGVRTMEESTTYQAIIARGRTDEARKILLRQGSKRFGPTDAHTRAAIEAITGIGRLEQLTERVLDASNWVELLATP